MFVQIVGMKLRNIESEEIKMSIASALGISEEQLFNKYKRSLKAR